MKLKTIRETRDLMNENFPAVFSPSPPQSNSSSRRSSAGSNSSFLSIYYNQNEDGADEVESYMNGFLMIALMFSNGG